ncbi:Kynurenine/alpha-aminoadipate aminotransferase, mitochondrial [Lamellibrachia satsuma]|nr:Kynurenine/alpha-aminoadipate aminotransferase, mitochondrial [Lamellibrachia satsuma]
MFLRCDSFLSLQALIMDMLHKWGIEGYLGNARRLCDFYRSKRDSALAAAKRWLTGLAEWNVPQAGIFMWLKIIGIEVKFACGSDFMADSEKPSAFVRLSYSLATAEQLDLAFERLAMAIREQLEEVNSTGSDD